MKRPWTATFLLHPHLNHTFEFGRTASGFLNGITRRSFLVRTGAATVAWSGPLKGQQAQDFPNHSDFEPGPGANHPDFDSVPWPSHDLSTDLPASHGEYMLGCTGEPLNCDSGYSWGNNIDDPAQFSILPWIITGQRHVAAVVGILSYGPNDCVRSGVIGRGDKGNHAPVCIAGTFSLAAQGGLFVPNVTGSYFHQIANVRIKIEIYCDINAGIPSYTEQGFGKPRIQQARTSR